MRFTLGIFLGALLACAAMPQQAFTRVQLVNFLSSSTSVQQKPTEPSESPTASALCPMDEEALKKLGSTIWKLNAVNRFDGITILSLQIDSKNEEAESICVDTPIGFALPTKVRVKNGKLVSAD